MKIRPLSFAIGALLLVVLTGCASVPRLGGIGSSAAPGVTSDSAGCPADAVATVRTWLERDDPSRDFEVSEVELGDVGPDVYQYDEDTGEESSTTIGAILGEAVDDVCAIEYTVDEIDTFHSVFIPAEDGVVAAIRTSFYEHDFWDSKFFATGLPGFTDDQYVIAVEEIQPGTGRTTSGFGVEDDERYADGMIAISVVFGG